MSAALRQMHHQTRSGALIGCDEDEEKFQETCAIPLLPNSWNTWLLARTVLDEPAMADLPQKTETFLKWVFSKGTVYGRLFQSGEIDSVRVKVLGTAESLIPQNVVNDLAAQKQVPIATLDGCQKLWPGELGMRAQDGKTPFVLVLVSFVYRGTRTAMPWPASRGIAAGLSPVTLPVLTAEWCPADTDWLLTAAFSPGDTPLPGRPKDKPWLDVEDPFGIKAALKGALKSGATGFGWALGLGVTAVGLYALSKAK